MYSHSYVDPSGKSFNLCFVFEALIESRKLGRNCGWWREGRKAFREGDSIALKIRRGKVDIEEGDLRGERGGRERQRMD